MKLFGHRGSAPENTLLGIERAMHAGVDGIEIDIRRLGEEIIVLHDETVDRTTDGAGAVGEMTFTALRELDAGERQRIPTLEECLERIDASVELNIEIKDPAVVDLLARELDKFSAADDRWRDSLLLSAFDNEVTLRLAAEFAEFRLGVLYKGEPFSSALARAQRLAAYSIHLPLADVASSKARAARAAGLRTMVYTVNQETDFDVCFAAGMDAVFTDEPRDAVCFRNQRMEGA